jgi:filamentous hemagglutinin family protein
MQLKKWQWAGAIGFTSLGLIAAPAQAQIQGDGTLQTQVNGSFTAPCTGTCFITNGSNPGGGNNLFHSFRQFSLPSRDFAEFVTTPTIKNVIVRVTGQGSGFISNINGTIQTSNPANFFLLNPNGIVFGSNARIFIGGSFLATTAEKIRFQDGTVFDTRDPAPLLTISIPSGLQMGQIPGNIQAQRTQLLAGILDNFGDFTLVGGNISLDNVDILTQGKRVEIGAAAALSTVQLNPNDNLRFSEGSERGDIALTNGTQIIVNSDRGGYLSIIGHNINLLNSSLYAGVSGGVGLPENQAGNLTLDASDTIRIGQASQVFNLVYDTGNGSAGNIDISTGSLFVTGRSFISASVGGTGSAGNLTINARDTVSLDGSGVFSIIFPGRVGQAKDIRINAGTLLIKNGAQVSASTLGRGDAGDVIINVQHHIVLNGVSANGELPSFIRSSVGDRSREGRNAIGQGGDIQINTGSLTVANGAYVGTFVYGTGNAGNITINAREQVTFDGFSSDDSFVSKATSELFGSGRGGNIFISTGALAVSNFAQLSARTLGIGNAGDITINARDFVDISSSGRVSSDVGLISKGDGGGIQIVTGTFDMTGDAFLTTRTSGSGNAGSVIINARDRVALTGNETTIDSSVRRTGNGEGGDIRISTKILELSDGAQVIAPTLGIGNAGDIVINASDRVSLNGSDTDNFSNTAIFSTVGSNPITNAQGRGGNVQISTNVLDVFNAQLATGTYGIGDAGDIIINARDRATFSGDGTIIASRVEDTGRGKGGDIRVTANTVEVLNDADLNASTLGTGDSGNIVIEARDRVLFDSGNAFSVARGATENSTGKGGDVRISTNKLEILNGALLSSSTVSAGDAGDVRISTNTLDIFNNAEVSSSASRGNGNAGDVVVEARDRVLIDNANISSRVDESSSGKGGAIQVGTGTLELFNNASLDASTSGGGIAGSLFLEARNRLVIGDSSIQVFSDSSSRAGDITITAPIVLLTQGLITAESAEVDGGNINLNVKDILLLRNGSTISTTAGTAQAGGDGGNITINTPGGFIVGVSRENSDITANAFTGSGGRVNITAQGIYGLQFRPKLTEFSDITASSEFGVSGIVAINTLGIDPNRGLVNLPATLADASNRITQRCPQRGSAQAAGTFYITGRGGLPVRPGDLPLSAYPTGEVRNVEETGFRRRSTEVMERFQQRSQPDVLIAEANAIAQDASGKIWLVVGQTSPHVPVISWVPILGCQDGSKN